MCQEVKRVVRDAAIVVALGAGIALGTNLLRPTGGIALIASEPYETLVPCPEFEGSAEPISPAEARAGGKGVFLVDARSAEAFGAWHLPGARSIPFDYLEPISPAEVRQVLSSGARSVVVYGDGEDPDSGEQLARELGGKGLKNVRFVTGGAPALRGRTGGGRTGADRTGADRTGADRTGADRTGADQAGGGQAGGGQAGGVEEDGTSSP
jgi:rhodanese-related sulfurtransferase